ncbi:unnamed protein product [Acanthosepion pharaonis]|uniref:Uncharacterized protein n=1 Tax=Acanthosepion pharaonis TaxID=158019 RepID=A0A812E7C0_ACAPH|nr:unnamed protein product [Sepia pharaonis]
MSLFHCNHPTIQLENHSLGEQANHFIHLLSLSFNLTLLLFSSLNIHTYFLSFFSLHFLFSLFLLSLISFLFLLNCFTWPLSNPPPIVLFPSLSYSCSFIYIKPTHSTYYFFLFLSLAICLLQSFYIFLSFSLLFFPSNFVLSLFPLSISFLFLFLSISVFFSLLICQSLEIIFNFQPSNFHLSFLGFLTENKNSCYLIVLTFYCKN